MEKISDCTNEICEVELTNGNRLHGTLAFYDFKQQVIHMRNFEIKTAGEVLEEGKFIVLNQREWRFLQVK